MERALEALQEVGDRIQWYQAERQRLLSDYSEAALAADTVGLRDRFASNYGSFLARFSRQYKTDAKKVKMLRRDGRIPATLLQDLDDLAKLTAAGRELDALGGRLLRALGSYFGGLETDVAAAERACETACRVLDLADPKSDLAALAAQVAVESKPDARILPNWPIASMLRSAG